jgi:hypothetical protein
MNTISWKNQTAEAINLYNYITTLLAGPLTIVPLYFQGPIAGSEFLTYAANKLYLALEFEAGLGVIAAALQNILLYDNTNTANHTLCNSSIAWDSTAANMKYQGNSFAFRNYYFSRIVATSYSSLKFNGYRITN